jgi:hypothetical protein
LLLRGGRRPLEIQRQQLLEDRLVVEIGGPAVGGEDGGVELLVRESEPGRAGVVEVRQSPLLELRGGLGVARVLSATCAAWG